MRLYILDLQGPAAACGLAIYHLSTISVGIVAHGVRRERLLVVYILLPANGRRKRARTGTRSDAGQLDRFFSLRHVVTRANGREQVNDKR
jgi:hypothetical protein